MWLVAVWQGFSNGPAVDSETSTVAMIEVLCLWFADYEGKQQALMRDARIRILHRNWLSGRFPQWRDCFRDPSFGLAIGVAGSAFCTELLVSIPQSEHALSSAWRISCMRVCLSVSCNAGSGLETRVSASQLGRPAVRLVQGC